MGPWVNGQPDGGPAQNCVVYGNYGDGGWLDYFCTGRLTSICESTHYNLWFVFQNQSTCFCLVSFFGRMFLYYQGQIHTSNLNFSAKNNFGAKMRNYFSLDEKKIVKNLFLSQFWTLSKMSHTYHMKKYKPVLLCQYKVRVKICPNIHTDLMLNNFETINS